MGNVHRFKRRINRPRSQKVTDSELIIFGGSQLYTYAYYILY